jgi:hypothetical protein
MLSTEREDFDKQLEVLFGGYPTFMTAPRKEAYWRGLQKMPLSVFIRCVDMALQDQSEEGKKLPTVNRVWELSRQLKARAQPVQQPQDVVRFDDYHLLGQRWLFGYLLKNGGIEPAKLPKLIAAKNRIVDQFRASGDIDGNVAEWLDVAMSTFEREAA